MKIVYEDQNRLIVKERNIISILLLLAFFGVGVLGLVSPMIFTTPMPFYVALFFIFIAVFAFVTMKNNTINIDKALGIIQIQQKGIFSNKTISYEIANIQSIDLMPEEQKDFSEEGVQRRIYYSLYFFTKDGLEIPLCRTKTTNGEKLSLIGSRIALFLGVLFNERRMPTVQEALKTISDTVKTNIEKNTAQDTLPSKLPNEEG